mmetsp:Transcript_28962/g.42275  ORF Transcript_28962/g.42275 Transcript_28962/m.42275 type:complete len:112 (-) Transcript_28962:64-399(-)
MNDFETHVFESSKEKFRNCRSGLVKNVAVGGTVGGPTVVSRIGEFANSARISPDCLGNEGLALVRADTSISVARQEEDGVSNLAQERGVKRVAASAAAARFRSCCGGTFLL